MTTGSGKVVLCLGKGFDAVGGPSRSTERNGEKSGELLQELGAGVIVLSGNGPGEADRQVTEADHLADAVVRSQPGAECSSEVPIDEGRFALGALKLANVDTTVIKDKGAYSTFDNIAGLLRLITLGKIDPGELTEIKIVGGDKHAKRARRIARHCLQFSGVDISVTPSYKESKAEAAAEAVQGALTSIVLFGKKAASAEELAAIGRRYTRMTQGITSLIPKFLRSRLHPGKVG